MARRTSGSGRGRAGPSPPPTLPPGTPSAAPEPPPLRDPLGGVKLDLPPIKPEVLAVRVIPRIDDHLAGELGLKLPPWRRAVGLLTCTSDDALYVALDEGTKAAAVEVAYARSFYAGAAHPSRPPGGLPGAPGGG